MMPLSAAEDLVRNQGSAQVFSPHCGVQAHFYYEQFVGFISACICLTSHVPKLPCTKKTNLHFCIAGWVEVQQQHCFSESISGNTSKQNTDFLCVLMLYESSAASWDHIW